MPSSAKGFDPFFNEDFRRVFSSTLPDEPCTDTEIRRAKQRADTEMLRYMAELQCPEDLKRFGKDHNIPTFAEFTWQAGFQQGWRLAMSRIYSETRDVCP